MFTYFSQHTSSNTKDSVERCVQQQQQQQQQRCCSNLPRFLLSNLLRAGRGAAEGQRLVRAALMRSAALNA
jgi:hypothetical protein